MKRILCAALLFSLALCLFLPISAFADGPGEGNIDGGGGGMEGGSGENVWSSGNEGVRITVVRASDHTPVTTPVDFTNKSPTNVQLHFGNVSKISYINGTSLSPSGSSYKFVNPGQTIPRIISTNGTNNIEEIKRYFCSEYVLMRVADETGMNYDVLIGGEYKVLLEPIAYYKVQGIMVASTAHEAALYDEQCSGLVRSKMGYLTHQNLPLAMFLETSDLGFPAWSGSRNSLATNADIKSSLGLGIVRFEELPEQPQLQTYDYEYRVNTEVITSVWVSGGQSDPDHPTTVTFNIAGRSYTVSNVYYPSGDSQLVWVRWTTPDEPQDMVINVTSSGRGSPTQGTINVKIVDLDRNPPPNPVADDRNDSWSASAVPSNAQVTSANWGVWRPWWYEYLVWHGSRDDGYWCDHGWWEFDFDRYSASLTATMTIKTDEHNPTASGRTMKSGYGLNQTVTCSVTTNQSAAVTPGQNAVSYFPEFGYERYWRLLDRMQTGMSSSFQFKENQYSTYRNRTHFTPIWFRDGSYTVYTWMIDSWTPTGMMSMNLTDSLTIRGNLWDDWHIAPLKP